MTRNHWIETDRISPQPLGHYTEIERRLAESVSAETCTLCNHPMHMHPGIGFLRCVGCGAIRVTRKINGRWVSEDRS